MGQRSLNQVELIGRECRTEQLRAIFGKSQIVNAHD